MEHFAWTEENTEILRRMWNDENVIATEIAKAIGTGKNSVIGKARRLKLKPRTSLGWRRGSQTLKPKKCATPPTPPAIVYPVKIESRPPLKSVLELEPGDCKWCPLDLRPGDAGFGFCGKPAISGEAWCAEHFDAMVSEQYRRLKRKRKRAEIAYEDAA